MTTTTTTRSATKAGRVPGVGGPVAYNRISRFRVARGGMEAEISRGVDRQAADADMAAEDLNLGPVLHFTDDGESASEYATKARTNWPEFLAYLATGQASHALLWNVDRATRTTEGADQFLAACRAGGVLVVQTATMQVADPNNIHDVHNLKQAALQAEYEVAKMSMRQRRAKAESVKAGTPHGGRRRFGYTSAMEPHETEAAVVRQLVTRFLAGESLYALAKWLNDEGIPTPSTEYRQAKGQAPAKWTGPNLRHLLAGPHLAGLRVHGKDANGRRVVTGKGTWTPIIPVETHDHVTALLNNPARRPKGSGNARKWLLSGLMVCDECGAPCRVRPEHTTTKGHRVPASYSCQTGRHVHRRADRVDEVVEKAVVRRLTKHDASGLFVDDTAAGELIRLREARDAVADRQAEYVAAVATMPAAAYAAATNQLQADLDALDVQIMEATTKVRQASRVLEGATGPGAAEAWHGTAETPGWSLARKRSIIAELAEVRLIGGRTTTTANGSVFNPEDVVVAFRED